MIKSTKFRIAHIDDDPIILDLAKMILEQNDQFEVISYNTAEEFLSHIEERGKPDLIIVDYFLNSKIPSAMDGSKLLEIFRKNNDQIAAIVISSQKDVDIALDLIQLSVADYIEKTDDFAKKILESVENVFEMKKIDNEGVGIIQTIRKDRKHLLIVALFLFAGISITLLAGLALL
jgi:two-component system response regulator AtoC